MGKLSFNNCNVPLLQRIANERYYSFLDNHAELYSMDGMIINNKLLKFVDVKFNSEEDLTDPLLFKLKNLKNAINGIKGKNFEYDEATNFCVEDLVYCEMNSTGFIENKFYRYTYVYNLIVSIGEVDSRPYHLYIPFIVVKEGDVDKLLLVSNCNRISDFTSEASINTFDIDSSLIKEIVDFILKELSPNDKIMARIYDRLGADEYVFREFSSEFKKTCEYFDFDTSLFNSGDREENYVDTPIITLTATGDIDRLLTTDLNTYKSMTLEEFNSSNNKAVVFRFNKSSGDFFLNPMNCNETVVHGAMVYGSKMNIDYDANTNEVIEKEVFVPSSESLPIYNGIIYVSPILGKQVAYGEGKITSATLDYLRSISEVAVDLFKKVMAMGNRLLKALKNAKMNLTYAGYVNEFIDLIFDTLAVIVPGAALMMLGAPTLGLFVSVITLVFKIDEEKGEAEEIAIKKVEQHFHEKVEEFKARKEKYEEEGNIKAANRIDKIVKDYEFKFDKIAKVKAGERV